MATLQATDIQDAVNLILNSQGKLKITDNMSTYQNTYALKRTMKKGKMTFEDGGTECEFSLLVDTNNSARFVGIGESEVVDVPNVSTRGKVGWRHMTWNWAMDGRLISMNSGSANKIFDLVQSQRLASLGSAVIKFETRFWRTPSSTDVTNPYGVPYWIVKSNTATSTNDGFNGTVPSGFTVVGNVNPTTYDRWRNYATQYTDVSQDDLVRKLRRAMVYTDFEPLVDGIPEYSTGDDMGLYSNYSVVGTLEEIARDQNENLGMDIASTDGKMVFRRTPIAFVKELDLDTTNPIYGINWGEFKCMALRGWWMKEINEPHVSGQSTVAAVHTYCTFNWIVRNRRRNFVLATNTTMGY